MRAPGVVALMVALACAPPPTVTTTTAAETTTSTATTTTTGAPCPDRSATTASGVVSRMDRASSDSRALGLISWQSSPGCDRFSFEFETVEGAPATTPPSIGVSFLEDGHVVRIDLAVDATVVTDQLVETGLVDRLYVVRALDGGMFVDLHLLVPVRAAVEASSSPATLTVWLLPETGALSAAARHSDRVVVVSPVPGSEVPVSLTVSGYTRTFEASVLVIATVGDQKVAEANTTAADWTETWGEFRVDLALPAGEVSLFVGERSPQDGRLAGVTINLVVR